MERALHIGRTDRINFLNIGLMLLSCAVALFIPVELFLFAYAILGPAHYLTEISWLQKRQFFTKHKYDFGLLAVLAAFSMPWTSGNIGAICALLGLGIALVLALADKISVRILGVIPIVAVAFALADASGFIVVLLALFVPTLIHVYLFTGFFMVYGALKERSRSGYLAVGVFLLCPVVCWMIEPGKYVPASHALSSYWNNFSLLNRAILGVGSPHTVPEAREALRLVFSSQAGLVVMRFIAFAYTYHYFNWFSKTSIIKWHEVGGKRLAAIAGLWIASIGLYFYDFAMAFKFLAYLSVIHVYLEFPLNHLSIIGTFREVRSLFGTPIASKPAARPMAQARRSAN
jgi:hypothetical protein